MTDNKKNEEDQMNRRSLIALASMVSLAVWHKPIINSVILPAHAQTSCPSIQDVDVIGNWLFTDAVGNTVEIDFIDENSLIIDNRSSSESWFREADSGDLSLEVRGSAPVWNGFISQESNCTASEITITRADSDPNEFTNSPFQEPLIGQRI